jgi:PRTRC genetic system ThiF family protein
MMSTPAVKAEMPVYVAPSYWRSRAIRIVVIGAGGNGSEVVDCLASFHHAIRSLGHPCGLDVTIIDDTIVREPNLVRQRFWPCDLGQFKAVSLANRYNLMLGLSWTGLPYRFPCRETDAAVRDADLIITAVDVPSARVAVANLAKTNAMWLDLGNGARHGQVVFGAIDERARQKFPNLMDAYPEISDLPDDNTKSCSVAESLAVQDCLINRTVTTAGLGIVWELLRYGKTEKHWIVLSLETGEQQTFPFPAPPSESSQAA